MDHCALVKCNKRNAERFQTLEEITSLLVIVYMVIAKKERTKERQKGESARKPEIQWLQCWEFIVF